MITFTSLHHFSLLTVLALDMQYFVGAAVAESLKVLLPSFFSDGPFCFHNISTSYTLPFLSYESVSHTEVDSDMWTL